MGCFPDRKKPVVEKYLPEINATMKHYEINSCLRKTHFLAQVGHESSELQYCAEILPKGVSEEKQYGGYKGRGLIQLTGKSNYEAYGNYIKQDLTGENRLKVEEPKLATDSAGWFWAHGIGKDLNIAADQNDLIFLSASINGGFNGYEGSATSRLSLIRNSVSALHVTSCPALEILFSTFPEFEKFAYDSYKLEKSKAFDIPDMAFAWGLWHDPDTKFKGVPKNKDQAKIGYSRYLELISEKPKKKPKTKRFGFKSRELMDKRAEERIEKLK